MELFDLIEVNPDVMNGQPCLKGTRIPVELVMQKLKAGETPERILAAYPQLSRDHIEAAQRYAVQSATEKELPSRPGKAIESIRRVDLYEDR